MAEDYARRRKIRFDRRNADTRGWFTKFFWTAYQLSDTAALPEVATTLEDAETPYRNLLLYAPPGIDEVVIDRGELPASQGCYHV